MKPLRVFSVISTVVLTSTLISRVQNLGLPQPIAVYPLDQQYGTKDISKLDNPPGKASGVELAPGFYGQPAGSYHFSGSSSSFIEFPNNGGLDARYSMTFTAWIKPERSTGPLLSYKTDNKDGVHVGLKSPNKLVALFQIRDNVLPYAIESGKIRLKAWNFVAASYDNSSGAVKLWIDGREVASLNVGRFEIATQGNVRVGAAANGSYFYKGGIACLQIYNKSLAEQEITAVKDRCPVEVQSHHIGCYADKAAAAIPSLEGEDPLLDGDAETREDAKQKCARVTIKRGFAYFALQDGGYCHSSLSAQDTYNKYGLSTDCKLGKGGKMAIDVYEVIMFRDQTCWHGWDAKEDSCFKLYNEKNTWAGAQAVCKAQRGALAKLDSEEKNYFVFLHLIKPANPSSSVWIGLSRDSENNFHWSDGAVAEYTNWGPGSPDSSAGNRKNATKLNEFSGLWEDSEFDFNHPFVCGRVLPKTPSEVHVTLMDSHSALVTWTTSEQQYMTSYYVEYKVRNSDKVQLKVVQNQNKTSLTGLQAYTVYELRVRAVNGAGGGVWRHFETFSTGETYPPRIDPFSPVRVQKPRESLILSCTARGGPEPTITWYRNRTLVYRGQQLVINDTSARGVYTCRASNGIQPDDIASVTVTSLTSPELKNVWGAGEEAEISLKIGEPLALQCETENKIDAFITWYKDEKPIHIRQFTSKSVINMKEMSENDFGVYKCKVENSLGMMSRTIKVVNAERLFHLKVAVGCLAALSFILLIVIAVLVRLLVKARKSAASKSKDDEPEEDPLPTLSGPRPSDSDFKVPEVRSSSTPAMLPAGSKSPYMALSTVDAPNGGASITFEATSF